MTRRAHPSSPGSDRQVVNGYVCELLLKLGSWAQGRRLPGATGNARLPSVDLGTDGCQEKRVVVRQGLTGVAVDARVRKEQTRIFRTRSSLCALCCYCCYWLAAKERARG
jgi:hypothetical protein